jgi:peptidyl-dipeptidase Dcp
VHDASRVAVGLFIQDNFARPSKRSGAWMSAWQPARQRRRNVLPIILNNNNNAKGSPTLLSFDDVRTLFHEFGHGLHGCCRTSTYQRLSGTNVLQRLRRAAVAAVRALDVRARGAAQARAPRHDRRTSPTR